MIELRKLAHLCDFGNFLEQALREICLRFSQCKLIKVFIAERNLILERALSIATAMEMAILESHRSKKAVTSSHTKEHKLHRKSKIWRIILLANCYCCGKKGHMAAQCRFGLTDVTSVTKLAIYNRSVQQIRVDKENPEKQQG